MKLIIAENIGFCFGVKNAVELAEKNAGENVFTYGEIIHNNFVTERLLRLGVKKIDKIEEAGKNSKVIIRSHGAGEDIHNRLIENGIKIIDATCPYVKNIHKIVNTHYLQDFHIVIVGNPLHAEVIGINGWCAYSATVISSVDDIGKIPSDKKICLVCQTTFSVEKWKIIQEKIINERKIVEVFDTICYTTSKRQNEARLIANDSSVVFVIGSSNSSNTNKLKDICKSVCDKTYLIESVRDINKVKFLPSDTVGIVAGASTPEELIREVLEHMGQKDNKINGTEVSEEFAQGVEKSFVKYTKGKRYSSEVITANETGIKVKIGGKSDAFIPADEVNLDGSYDMSEFVSGSELDVIITDTTKNDEGLILVSKKEIDRIKEGDKVIETIRDGKEFSIVPNKETKGGLLGRLGTYSVFIPASHIRHSYVADLKPYLNKALRLTILSIDDDKHKIVASQRKLLDAERAEKEEKFWSKMESGVVVSGKVKRATDFGAFVSVDGFDCLAHIVDLAWYRVKNVEEVLTIGESYEFVVLSADKEKNRVSLGYKQLQPHPFEVITEKYPEGSTIKGKVVRIVPFGAFVSIESGVDGLVHVSEAAHGFVKNINDVLKVDEEVEAKVTKIDFENKKISLSIKALLPEVEQVHIQEEHEEIKENEKIKGKDPKEAFQKKAAGAKGISKPRKTIIKDDGPREWSEETSNNPFADLLKDFVSEEEKSK